MIDPLVVKTVTPQTVYGLHDALSQLIRTGHGGIRIMRADSNEGWTAINNVELYDTTPEKKSGELLEDRTFLIC